MKHLVTFGIVFIFSINSIFSQSQLCDCKSDLDFLVEKLKGMPSYKKQIKGDKLIKFQNTYNDLSQKMVFPISIADCFSLLNQQLMVITDYHASVRAKATYLSEDDYYDEQRQQAFQNTEAFKNHPKFSMDLAQLESNLKVKSNDDIEGIYNYGSQQTVGITKINDSTIVGVVLTSTIKIWEPGQIKFVAQKNQFGKYDMYTYHNRSRQLLMVKNLTLENGRIWSYKKKGNTNNYETDIKNKSNWDFKQINDDVQYVYFGKFSSSSSENKKAFRRFYENHKNGFTAKHIIVDLRSNGGGNKKLSDPFLKLFRKSKAKIYVITNCYTGSNAEQFALKLKKIKGAIHLGQTTYGVLAYGINYGTSYDTPSGHFKVTPTDMNFHKYFEYEGLGVTPDIKLDFDRDWIEQTLEIIDENN
ncbi:S41 family peptidase [uncultured Psychroserpens sp.]|uniref:S41 family peptidase n=1 Tax=uncultured Psychroserpens sp. TaxID=255436 RepID=UPI00260524E0|nr:S41 family peptidase [uncultured Psychroserpens sp.]